MKSVLFRWRGMPALQESYGRKARDQAFMMDPHGFVAGKPVPLALDIVS
ncbi:hypothetical protein GB927_018250 [Shinella sp. CPCC 100929]|uniref:Uncharacterized protein n=1 Tax=Shinella lacus TaxID=2654216 RepID=A0ABT1RAA0_9HYPH|nr:hypothetical protein [Shinella lacus]